MSHSQDAAVVRLWKKYKNTARVAATVNVTEQTVISILRRCNVKEVNKKSLTNEDIIDIMDTYRHTVTIDNLAKRYELSYTKMRNLITRSVLKFHQQYPNLPYPNNLKEIKIFNHLRIDSTLTDEDLRELTNIMPHIIAGYTERW